MWVLRPGTSFPAIFGQAHLLYVESLYQEPRPCERIGRFRRARFRRTGFVQIFRFNTMRDSTDRGFQTVMMLNA